MTGIEIALLGAAMAFTPVILALVAGVRTDEDAAHWFVNLPLRQMIAFRLMIIGGTGLLGVGLLLAAAPHAT